MANENEYMAVDRMPVEDIVVGARCYVPVWFRGFVLGWYPAKITEVRPVVTNENDARIVAKNDYNGREQIYASYSISKRIDKTHWLLPGRLTVAQQRAVESLRAANVPASWFVGEQNIYDSSIEVVAIGNEVDPTFAWSFRIAPDGEYTSSEATGLTFSTGINCLSPQRAGHEHIRRASTEDHRGLGSAADHAHGNG